MPHHHSDVVSFANAPDFKTTRGARSRARNHTPPPRPGCMSDRMATEDFDSPPPQHVAPAGGFGHHPAPRGYDCPPRDGGARYTTSSFADPRGAPAAFGRGPATTGYAQPAGRAPAPQQHYGGPQPGAAYGGPGMAPSRYGGPGPSQVQSMYAPAPTAQGGGGASGRMGPSAGVPMAPPQGSFSHTPMGSLSSAPKPMYGAGPSYGGGHYPPSAGGGAYGGRY